MSVHLSVENNVLQLVNAPFGKEAVSQVQAREYTTLGIAIIGYFFKWLVGAELSIQADDGKWYVVSKSRLESYLRAVDKLSHIKEATGLRAGTVKEWLQAVKQKANIVANRIAHKAQNRPPLSVESELVDEVGYPRVLAAMIADYAVPNQNPGAVRAVENALKRSGGKVNAECQALLQRLGDNFGATIDSLNLGGIIIDDWRMRDTYNLIDGDNSDYFNHRLEIVRIFPNLKKLRVDRWATIREQDNRLAQQLEELYFDPGKTSQPLYFPDTRCTNLRVLSGIGLPDFEEYRVQGLPVLPRLERLSITAEDIMWARREAWFSVAPKHREKIPEFKAAAHPLPLLAERFVNLTHLDFTSSSALKIEHLDGLELFPRLTELNLTGCEHITAEHIAIIQANNPDLVIIR